MTVTRKSMRRQQETAPYSAEVHPPEAGPARRTLRARLADDRGDVPGWVMITLMTAAIVVALWAVASDQLVAIFNNAMAPFLQGI